MGDVLAFWTVAMVVGLSGFPLAAVLLRRLPDAGAGLSFAFGLLVASYGYFILRTLSVLPAGRGGFVLAVALLWLVAAVVAGRDRWLLVTWRRAWPGAVAAATLFSFAFFGYLAFRSYNADIGGTEQPMDLMYLNAALTSPEYPPHDPWLAGERASYYYFGYVQSAVLTGAAGVPASSGYNMALAYTFAAAAAGVGSLAFALARWIGGRRSRGRGPAAAAALALLLLLFVGSLSAVFEWSAAHGHTNEPLFEAFGVEWMIPCEPGETENCYSGQLNPRTDHWYPGEFWFWWRGTRIIPGTITEFPFFSFLLGDLHPHVMSLPLVLLSLGLSLSLWRGRGVLDWRRHRQNPWPGVTLAVVFGGLAFQNAWDVITFSAVLGLAAWTRNLRRQGVPRASLAVAGYLGPIAMLALLAYAPWWLTFGSQADGLYAYTGAGTRPAHAFLQFGPLLAGALLVLIFAGRRARAWLVDALLGTAWIPLLPFVGWLALAGVRGDLAEGLDARTAEGWVTLAAYALAVWALATAAVMLAAARSAAAPAAALAATGALLLYGGEFFFIRDVFFGSVPRLNTVFKLSYQAWVLLALAGGAAISVGLGRARAGRSRAGLLGAPILLLVMAGLAYPLLAAFNRTEGFSRETTLDGLSAVARNDPNDYALLRWLQENAGTGDVIFEATGRRWNAGTGAGPVIVSAGVDYSDAGRMAARSGLQTPIGWYFHEIQWRGDTAANRAEFSRRQNLVDAAYTSRDPEEVIAAMRTFEARYLVVGTLEMASYPGLLPDYAAFLDTVYEAGAYRIYAIPEYRRVATS